MTNKQLPPHSIEAEQAVLGGILIDPDAYYDVIDFLKPEHFYKTENQNIYKAMCDLKTNNEPVDFVTLQEKLQDRNFNYTNNLIDYINAVPTSINTRHYGRIVLSKSLRRQASRAASSIATMAHDENIAVSEVIKQAQETILKLSDNASGKNIRPIKAGLNHFIELIESHTGETQTGISTGYSDLDRLLNGFQRNDFVILAGRPGMGKSAAKVDIEISAALAGGRVASFNLEMTESQQLARSISKISKIDLTSVLRYKFNELTTQKLFDAIGKLSNLKMWIDDTSGLSLHELQAKCRRIYAEHGLDLITVDYLQLMSTEGRYNGNREQEISQISRGLKNLARDLNCTVLGLAQLSRACEQRQNKRPKLSDLRESGCLTGDTLITMRNGLRIPISDIKAGDEVLSLNENTMTVYPSIVSNAFTTGRKMVYKITTSLGRTIKVTANHRFLSSSGWLRLDELSENDRIAIPRVINTTSVKTMSDSELALIGHLIGDGCTLKTSANKYTTSKMELAKIVENHAKNVFGDSVKVRVSKERTWLQVYLSSATHLTHGVRSPVTLWLESLGIYNLYSYEKFVPECIFTQPKEKISLFLRNLWSTDGSIRMIYGKSPKASIYYATSSKRLAYDVQSLLLTFGINARLSIVPQVNKGRDQYHVTVSGIPDISRYIECIGFVGNHQGQEVKKIRKFIDGKVHNTNRDVIPPELWVDIVKNAMKENNISHRQLYKGIGNSYGGMTIFKQNISRERAKRISRVVKCDDLMILANSDVYWDKVTSIKCIGEQDVYDLTVPSNHNFLANNIIVHNSLEQDSDIVMFLYRDEYYNPDTTERPNIAELNVAKHRNGPTGTIDLYWNAPLTTFGNLKRQEILLPKL